jgi:sortase (surface protein transpeptidase)
MFTRLGLIITGCIICAALLSGCGQFASANEEQLAAVTQLPTSTPALPTSTPALPTSTPAPPTSTPAPPTSTPAPPTSTPAPPTSTPAPVQATNNVAAVQGASLQPADPARIVIDNISMDLPLVSVGLDANRVPIVPKHDAAWFNMSARPGEGENVVLWGHVLSFSYAPHIPAPFARVEELSPGTPISIYDAQGNAHTYQITEQVWALPSEVEYILPQGSERLTLVSCIGDQVVENGRVVNMTHRLITIATPVE